VPTSHAAALAKYLLANRVVVSRPEPCTPETQTVTLIGKVDVEALEKLLSDWQ
jgi:hypothetical protein